MSANTAAGQIERAEAMLAAAGEAYLVGSANWGLAADPPDLDYVTAADPIALGHRIARELGGHAVVLDANRRYVRLALPRCCPLDLAPLTDGDLGRDLARRDFTINAIAAMLPARRPLLDPFRGRTDFRHAIARQVSATAFAEDPLRVLRGIRLVAERGFTVEPDTLRQMQAYASRLVRVHPERIHTELRRTLSGRNWVQGAEMLLDLHVWHSLPSAPQLEPGPEAHRAHILALARCSADVLASTFCRGRNVGSLGGIAARGWAVLASAIITSGEPVERPNTVALTLRLTREEESLVVATVSAYGELQSGVAVPEVLERHRCAALWAGALQGDERALDAMLSLRPPPAGLLPSGDKLASHLGREPGPWLGDVLRQLRRAAIAGDIRRPADAIALAERLARDIGESSREAG